MNIENAEMATLITRYSPLFIWRPFNKIFALLLSSFILLSSEVFATPAEIVKISSLEEISISLPENSLVFFDIDETLIDSPHMLGSKTWRSYMKNVSASLNHNWHDLFSLILLKKYPYTTVEPITATFVRNLQLQGHAVCGLTARERHRWYDAPNVDVDVLTIAQMASVGINFDTDLLSQRYPLLTEDSEYFSGVFFADMNLKGDYLRKVFKDGSQASELPKMIMFVDDRLAQVRSVDAFLDEMHIDHICYWYCATDANVDKFDPAIANIQLYFFLSSNGSLVISDEMASYIQKENPSQDYLKAILEL